MHFALSATSLDAIDSPDWLLTISDRTVHDLLLGGDFYVPLAGRTVDTFYTPDEVAHLMDARAVLYLFVALAVASLVLIVATLIHRPNDARRWWSVARGGAGLAVGAVVVGVVGFIAFDAAFELFHRVFFPGGNWEFPADSNMIRLYPYAFWQLTAGALGVWCVVIGGAVWWLARRRAA
jgi:integral membrane protein (TIGR01906 family)